MGGDSSVGDGKSVRKRLAASIRRVMSIGKRDSASASRETPVPVPATVAIPTTSANANANASASVNANATTTATATVVAPVIVAPPISGAITTIEPKTETKAKLRTTQHAPKSTVPAPPRMSTAERAQELFKKHGLDISSVDWPLSKVPQGERVQKEIRMRVHRTCHRCGTTYTGADKVCCECSHRRCTKCPRNPIKKPKDKGKGKEKIGDKITRKKKKDYISSLTLPSRTGGQDLVRKVPRQRVHRKCHRCSTDFAGEKICKKCNHHRCKTCPREPFKKNRPPGYYDGLDPSDSDRDDPIPCRPKRVYRKPRRRVHWTCKRCGSTFEAQALLCEGCGSKKTETGLRDPPRKQSYKPSAEDLERLEQRLKQTSLSA